MAKKEKKDYEKPELSALGDSSGEIPEKDLDKVTGGDSGGEPGQPTSCGTGYGHATFNGCGTGYGDNKDGCESGYQAQGNSGCLSGISFLPQQY